MRKIAIAVALPFALASCASGRFISAGNVDYDKFYMALQCEVERVFAEDLSGQDGKQIYQNWKASVDVTFVGSYNRDGGISASAANYDIGGADTLGGNASISRSFNDKGTIELTSEVKAGDRECEEEDAFAYDVTSLGLSSWFAKISRSTSGEDTSKLVRRITFKRIVGFSFGPNKVTVSVLSPIKIAPSLGFSLGDEATINIVFERQKPPPPLPKPVLVSLDDASLNRLADIIRRSGPDDPSALGERVTPPRARTSGPRSTTIRQGKTDREIDDELQKRKLERELEEFNDNFDRLESDLLLD